MGIFERIRCVIKGYGIKSHIDLSVKIKKSHDSIFKHNIFYMREFGKIIIRDNAKLEIGNKTFFNRNAFLTCQNEILIGNNVIFGPNLVIVDHNHDYKKENMANSFVVGKVFIGDNVWIGANVTILPGAYIEDGAIIGANSVISKRVPKNEIWGGVPAHFIKNRFN